MKHPCLICQTECDYYFSKIYENYPSCPFITQWKVDYVKCPDCGFVFSKTHQALPAIEWNRLNSAWHHYYESHFEERITNQPPYADQALALTVLEKNGLINLNNALDFAAGYGTLSNRPLKNPTSPYMHLV